MVLAAASPARAGDADTLWFGGVDENGLAIQGGTWDFEDGTLQGWTALDLSDEGDVFRHVTVDSCAAHASVDCPVITEGGSTGSMWAGVFPDEAGFLCWPGGQGHGNRWSQELRRSFAYDGSGDVTLTFDYFVDTEARFDFTYVYVEAAGARSNPLNTSAWATPEGWGYSGDVQSSTEIGAPDTPATDLIVLGDDVLPDGAGDFDLIFRVETDIVLSDALDFYPDQVDTRHGAFGVDDVRLVGGGLDHLSDFEPTGVPGEELDGWVSIPDDPLGTFHQVVPLTGLPYEATPPCGVEGEVMVAARIDGTGVPHPLLQAARLRSSPAYVGDLDVSPDDRWLATWDAYEYFATSTSGLGYDIRIDYHPWTCPETGTVGWTLEPVGAGARYEAGQQCLTRSMDVTGYIPASVDSLRVVFEVIQQCPFTDCFPELVTESPYFDNVRIGLSQVVGVDDPDVTPPASRPGVLAVSPNPIRTAATIRFALEARTRVRVDVLDVSGRVVAVVHEGDLDAGRHALAWSARTADEPLPAGVHWMRLRADGRTRDTKRVVVLAP